MRSSPTRCPAPGCGQGTLRHRQTAGPHIIVGPTGQTPPDFNTKSCTPPTTTMHCICHIASLLFNRRCCHLWHMKTKQSWTSVLTRRACEAGDNVDLTAVFHVWNRPETCLVVYRTVSRQIQALKIYVRLVDCSMSDVTLTFNRVIASLYCIPFYSASDLSCRHP